MIKIGHKGQQYDELLNEMAEAYKRKKFFQMLKERREEDESVEFYE